jgi:hypothetical protein
MICGSEVDFQPREGIEELATEDAEKRRDDSEGNDHPLGVVLQE